MRDPGTKATAARKIAALFGIVVLAAPGVAQADHRDYSHWGHRYQPLISADCTNFGGTFCDYTTLAETTWVNHNFPNGFRGGNPYQGCTQLVGWITNCITTAGAVQSIPGCTSPGTQACTRHWFVNNPNYHKQYNRIDICGTCGVLGGGGGVYSVSELRSLMRHEYGHAIGLGHTTAADSVMRDPRPVPGGPVQHDRDALTNEYNHVDP